MFKLHDGRRIAPGNPFEYDGNLYPANFIQLSTPAEKEAMGLVEIIEQPRPDDRFYWVNQNDDGSWNKKPKDLDQLKATQIAQIKQIAGSMLESTDYQAVREFDGGKPMSAEIKTFRAAVRAYSNKVEDELLALKTVAALEKWAALPFEWPVDSSSPADRL